MIVVYFQKNNNHIVNNHIHSFKKDVQSEFNNVMNLSQIIKIISLRKLKCLFYGREILLRVIAGKNVKRAGNTKQQQNQKALKSYTCE